MFQNQNTCLEEAQSLFAADDNLIVTIFISAGVHHLSYPHLHSSLDLTGPQPGQCGRLIIEGAGSHETVLVTDPWHTTLQGQGVRRLTVRNIMFKRDRPLTSQGVVTEVGEGFLTLEIDGKYPSIQSIFNWESKRGRYLKKYEYVKGDCEIVENKNSQVQWNRFKKLENNKTLFFLNDKHFTPNYHVGDLIGVKSKCCGHSHNTYAFCGGQI